MPSQTIASEKNPRYVNSNLDPHGSILNSKILSQTAATRGKAELHLLESKPNDQNCRNPVRLLLHDLLTAPG